MEIKIDGKFFGRSQVLGKIAFNIASGETVALFGPSGIGKSTLLRLIAGLDTDFDGTIRAGDPAIVFQEPTLLPWRHVVQNITLATGMSEAEASGLLREVGLGGRETDFPGTLSLGQQRRLGLARALAANSSLLLLDEPLASLDRRTADTMRDLLKRLVTGGNHTTLIVTHDARDAAELADRLIHLDGSPARITLDRKLVEGTIEEIDRMVAEEHANS